VELQLVETALEDLAPALLVDHERLDAPEALEHRLVLLFQSLQAPVQVVEVSEDRAELLVDLGVAASSSRPRVSNDNPFSEAQFKTLKYRPQFPERFEGLEHARAHLRGFFAWYNEAHRHSGIGFMTPAAVHFGQGAAIHAQRAQVLKAAYAANPARFKHRVPTPPALPTVVGINLPKSITQLKETAHALTTTPALLTNFLTEVSQSH
jgi:putative transposase